MFNIAVRTCVLFLLVAAIAMPAPAWAVTRTWLNTTANNAWSTNNNWDPSGEPTSIDPVIFPSPVPGSPAIIMAVETASSLTFNDSYTLTSSLGSSLNLITGNINVASGKTALIVTPLNGMSGLTKSGAGTLVLNPSGANGFSGDINILGTLSVNKDGALGNASNTVVIGPTTAGGTLQVTNTFSTARVISCGRNSAISVDSGETFTINTGLGATASAPLTVSGSGTLWLSSASTRSGEANITNGKVHLDHGAGLGTGATTVANNGTLELGVLVTKTTSTSLRNTATLRTSGEVATQSGGVTVDPSASVTLNGGDSAGHALWINDYLDGNAATTHVTGSGTVFLYGDGNTYSGSWSVDGGTLDLRHANSITASASPIVINSGGTVIAEVASSYLGDWNTAGLLMVQNAFGLGLGTSAVQVNTGGTLQIGGVDLVRDATLAGGAMLKGLGNATASGNITAASAVPQVTLATGSNSSDTLTVSNYTGGSGTMTTVAGAGEVILPNANTYAGTWQVNGGSLRVDQPNALGTNTAPVVVNSGGQFHVNCGDYPHPITLNNGAKLAGSGTLVSAAATEGVSIAPGAAVTFKTLGNPTGLVIGDGTNELTGGGGVSSITLAPSARVTIASFFNSYIGSWFLRNGSSLFIVHDESLGDPANPVSMENASLLTSGTFSTSRLFIFSGALDSAIHASSGTLTLNSGLQGGTGTLFLDGGTIVMNALSTLSGFDAVVTTDLKLNHNQALASIPLDVGNTGSVELGTNITLSQAAFLNAGATLRGNNNSRYNGVITVGTVDGENVTLATVVPGDVFTIGDGANDLTGGAAGSVITAAGPGKILLAQANNVASDWLITGGIIAVAGGNRLGTGSVTASGGALEINNASIGAVPLTLANNGALRATGVGNYTNSGFPNVTNASANIFLTPVGPTDRLDVGSAIRNVTAAPSAATIHVNGLGRVVLQAGGTTATDTFSGAWEQSSGILQVGQTNGNSINGLGFKNGDAKQANSIRVNGGTLAVGVPGSGAGTPAWLRANITVNGGSIASTNDVNAQYGGDFIVEIGSTSRVLVFDPVNPGTARNVSLIAGNPGPDNNAAITHWRAGSTLIVDPGTTSGGVFTIARDGGTVNVAATSPTLQINEGATVVLAGTVDALSEGVKHVNVVNNSSSSFNITQGNKNIGTLSGTGNTSISAGASLTVHQNVNSNYGAINGAGALIKEGAGTLTVGSVAVGALTVNGGAVNSPSTTSIDSGQTITMIGGSMSAPSLIDNGTLIVSSGTIVVDLLTAGNDGTLSTGSGTGSVDISGGTVSAKKVLLGSSGGGSGTLTVRGTGSLESERLSANDLIVNGGSVTITPPPFASDDPTLDGSIVAGYVHSGAVIVNGGTVSAPRIKLGVSNSTSGTYNQTGGAVTVTTFGAGNDGTLSGGAGTGTATISGGTLSATNLLVGSTAGGAGSFNWSGGSLSAAELNMSGAAALGVTLAGATLATGYAQLQVSGSATLGGTLNITRSGGYEPQVGDSFVILTYGSRTGEFSHVTGLSAGSGKVFRVEYNSNNVTLTVSAAPGGDVDGDGDVDANDFLLLNTCSTRDGVPHNGMPMCQAADFDHDNDVDVNDFGVYQRCVSGVNVPANPACAD